jgi:hypothetical protein
MPTRLGGLGLQSLSAIADAAYLASASKAKERISVLKGRENPMHDVVVLDAPPQSQARDTFFDEAADRLAGRLPGGRIELEDLEDDCDGFRQQRVALAVCAADADRALQRMNTPDRATAQACRAPGSGRWLLRPPTLVGDTVFSSIDFTTAVLQMLGVASLLGIAGDLCKFCGCIRDGRGIHDRSCTAGGDITVRHNAVRDAIFRFACRGRLQPILERIGLLAEPGMLLDLRRPADVLIEGALNSQAGGPGSSPLDRLALDVKVINALGPAHIEATAQHPLAAAEAYHDHAMALQQTATRCAERGITYAPLVFTAQGGMASRAEAVLHQIANKVAEAEGITPQAAFAEIADEISCILAKHGARSTRRRAAGRRVLGSSGPSAPLWRAAGGLPPEGADEDGTDEGEEDDEDLSSPMVGIQA